MCLPIILPVSSNTISLFRFSFCHKDIMVNVAAPICHWMKLAGQFVIITLCFMLFNTFILASSSSGLLANTKLVYRRSSYA